MYDGLSYSIIYKYFLQMKRWKISLDFAATKLFFFFFTHLNSSSHKWVTPKTNQQKEVFMEQVIPEKRKQMCI